MPSARALAPLAGTLLIVASILAPRFAAAQALPLRRDVPAPVPAPCPADARTSPALSPRDAQEAARLATSATQSSLLGDHAGARDLLDRAARLDPGAANVAFLYGRTLIELSDSAGAMREYCRYLALAGNAPDAQEVRDRVRRLAPLVRPGIPDSAVARFGAALALADASRLAEADPAFGAVIAAAPSWPAPYYDRALVRAAIGRRSGALSDFERFLELEPAGGDATQVAAWIRELRAPTAARYSAGAAFALGLLPGAGHFYTGRPFAGLFFLAAGGGAIAVGVAYERNRVECLGTPDDGVCPPEQVLAEHNERPYFVAGLAAGGAAILLSALDAARGARSRNAEPEPIRLSAADGRGAPRLLGPALAASGARVDVSILRLRF